MDEEKIALLKYMQENHKVEAARLADLLEMNDETMRLMVDLYNTDQLNPESRFAMEALEAMAEG